MPAYLESDVSGTSWRRATSLTFVNAKVGPNSVEIKEEDIVVVNGKEIATPAPGICRSIGEDALSTVFQLRNPMTNEVIPGAYGTYEQVYVLLFSLYWHLAEERDAAQLVAPPALPEEELVL
jgi:hypothetical protein